jgi:hypothetical protein
MTFGITAGQVFSAVAPGIVGGLLGGSSSGSQTQASEPWAEQKPYLTEGFANAKIEYDKAAALGNYQGQYTANTNPFQTQGYNGAAQFAQGQGMNASGQMLQSGMGNMQYGNQYGVNAQAQYGQLQGSDPTQAIIGAAGQYANNPYMDSMVDAASRDVNRNLNEQQLTGLDLAASGSGNMNSSRTGVAQGIMQRGASDQIGDISAQLRGGAYNNGLNMGQSQYNQNINQQMNANGQLLTAGNYGLNATGQGLNAGYNAQDATATAGAGLQNLDQNQINGSMAQFNNNQNNGLNLAGKYQSLINGNFGSTSTSTGTGSVAQGAMTGALGGMGLYSKFMGQSQPSMGSQAGNAGFWPTNGFGENIGT